MSAINVNSITGRTGLHGPVLTGVSTAADGFQILAGEFKVNGISTFVGMSTFNGGIDVASGDLYLSPPATGRLGVGTDSALRQFEVVNATHATAALKGNTQSSLFFVDSDDSDIGQISYLHADNDMYFRVNDAERLRITSDGKVGINSTSPGGQLCVTDTSTYTVNIGPNGGDGALVSTLGGSASLALGTDSIERLRITTDKVMFSVDAKVDANNLRDLGASGARWKRGYFATGLIVTGEDSGTVDGLIVGNTSTTNGGLTIGVNSSEEAFFWNGSNTSMNFATNNVERLRITSGGRLLYGNHQNDRGCELQYEGSQHACMGIHRNHASHGAPAFVFSASRGTSAGSNTIVQSDDYLGMISFKGADGSDLASGAYITGIVDGTPGSNDMPTRLGFWTSLDGSQSPTERLRIESVGRVSIGLGQNCNNFGTNFTALQIHSPSGVNSYLSLTNNTTGTNGTSAGLNLIQTGVNALVNNRSAGYLSFSTSDVERMHITSSGDIGVKTSSPGDTLDVNGTCYFRSYVAGAHKFGTGSAYGSAVMSVYSSLSLGANTAAGDYRKMYIWGTSGSKGMYFYNGSNEAQLSPSGVWTDASDERIKKDIVDIKYNGIDTVLACKPRSYKMKANDEECIGFIAQEMLTVVPEVVKGGEIDEDGEQRQYSLSYNQLTTIAFKAIQEQQVLIKSLEQRLTDAGL